MERLCGRSTRPTIVPGLCTRRGRLRLRYRVIGHGTRSESGFRPARPMQRLRTGAAEFVPAWVAMVVEPNAAIALDRTKRGLKCGCNLGSFR